MGETLDKINEWCKDNKNKATVVGTTAGIATGAMLGADYWDALEALPEILRNGSNMIYGMTIGGLAGGTVGRIVYVPLEKLSSDIKEKYGSRKITKA